MAYKTKLTEIMEGMTDMNERDFEKDIETVVAEDFVAPTMPSLTEMRAAVPKTEEPVPPVATFKHYAETVQNLRKSLRMAQYQRGKRTQPNLTDVQAEALDRIVEGVAMLLTYDSADVTWWNAIAANAELGKG